MVRSTPLDPFPNDLRFPTELSSRIYYDAQRKSLCYQGFMSKSEFDKLSRLHNDYRYQRALENLFKECTFIDEPRARFPAKTLVASLAVFGVAAAVIGWFWRH